jgi:hypothetical protein
VRAFLSYSRADRDWARQFSEHLRCAGVNVWFDEWEIFPGDNTAAQIGGALESADALLILISPASATSEMVLRELQFALGSERFERRVIPVIVQPTSEMPWILNTFAQVSGTPAQAAVQVAGILRSQPAPAAPPPLASSC